MKPRDAFIAGGGASRLPGEVKGRHRILDRRRPQSCSRARRLQRAGREQSATGEGVHAQAAHLPGRWSVQARCGPDGARNHPCHGSKGAVERKPPQAGAEAKKGAETKQPGDIKKARGRQTAAEAKAPAETAKALTKTPSGEKAPKSATTVHETIPHPLLL